MKCVPISDDFVNYLQDANQLKNPNVPVADSVQLLRTAMRLLPDSSADHSKAENLLYAFTSLLDSA
jgi:hypothetical protein